ncbi:conserved exported protein of unknown function [Rhodovastum atsumiense]|uniref:SH3 domain-containing protein n=1 Tax=Rhodovastum atsumiense TaxID=504468 RepID=A0A5M6IU48_9PROT|nr:SH3 domain-containing protein [Rhodovastum atsumiense]KAA5611459.1 hypothetical protein F1189_14090 [Rhodovastum atsumiense]CAH2601146.1 conserved exported protein of unknown function [Rhodovastum atsumiense]
MTESQGRLGLVLAGLLAVSTAAAQVPAPSPESTPRQPGRTVAPTAPPPPQAAPRPPGQQGGPPRPGQAKAPPVVTPPASGHAQKPGRAGAKAGAAAAAGAAAGVAAGAAGAAADPSPEEDIPLPEPPRVAPDPSKGPVTGLAIPRWASLRSDEINLRSGPGTRYPIEWVYRRRDLPVQIEREFDVWRLIEDQEGVKGWVHTANLTGRRSFMVKTEQVMRRSASEDANPVAVLKPGVVGRLRNCEAKATWCEAQVGEYRGFLRRETLYGIYPEETVN